LGGGVKKTSKASVRWISLVAGIWSWYIHNRS
jgi:hypothetical protein